MIMNVTYYICLYNYVNWKIFVLYLFWYKIIKSNFFIRKYNFRKILQNF